MSGDTAANLASMLENRLDNIVLKSYTAGSTLSVMHMGRKMGLRDIVYSVLVHKGNGTSPGDCMLLFITIIHYEQAIRTILKEQHGEMA